VATEPKEKERLLVRGARLKRVSEKLTQSAEADPEHGCNAQGVFYVRDSIYTDPSQPLYDYDLSQAGEETHLGYPVILREYAWLKHVSNHITQITATL
jgi:hypothetical protein